MNNIFEELLRYGFHDTKISSIDGEGLEIKLNFDNGIYFLNENGKETNLSNSIQIVLRLDSFFDSFEDAFEIKEYTLKNYPEEIDIIAQIKKGDLQGAKSIASVIKKDDDTLLALSDLLTKATDILFPD